MSGQSNRLEYLDGIRGLAAVIVLVDHYASAFYPSARFGRGLPAHGSWEFLFSHTTLSLVTSGQFAVCVFFVLSGFVLSHPYFAMESKSSEGLLMAAIKRPIRLGGLVCFSRVVAYLLLISGCYWNVQAAGISGSIPWLKDFWSGPPPSFLTFLRDLFLSPFSGGIYYNAPLWTIEIELYGSFLTFGFMLLFRGSNWRWPAYLVLMVWCRWTYFGGFLIGIALADLSAKFPGLANYHLTRALSWGAIVVGLLFGGIPNHLPKEEFAETVFGRLPPVPMLGGGYHMLGAGLFVVGTILNPTVQRWLGARWLGWLGKISYPLYALHFLVLGSFSSFLFVKITQHFSYHVSVLLMTVPSAILLVGLCMLALKYVDEPAVCAANWMARKWKAGRHTGHDASPAPRCPTP